MIIEESTKNKIKVAIAGLGFGEKVHLKALNESDLMLPVALWHPRLDRLTIASEQYGIPGYTDWDLLLEDKNIEAIIIATPPEPRYGLAIKALNAGKHLFLEKPIALNSSQIINLQKLAISKGLTVAVDFEYRAVPHFQQAKELLSNNTIGTPWLIKLDWLMGSRANKKREWNWYSEREKGGGVIGALGTHAFDILHWFFGPTTSVTSLLSTSIKERPASNSSELKPVTSEDICLAQLQLKSNSIQSIIPAQVTLSAVSKEGRGFWLEVYGSEGTLILGSDNQKDYVHGFGLWLSNNETKLQSVQT